MTRKMELLTLSRLISIGLLIIKISNNGAAATNDTGELEIVSRQAWRALPPKLVENMTNPVPYVIIHHSYTPSACHTHEECIEAMLEMQKMHQVTLHKWNDIGYNFGVGGDRRAYEGRGWNHIGAHAPGYNNRSIGICVIGDWTTELPSGHTLSTVKHLIHYGINKGYITPNYVLLGHRQTRPTECPGERLYQEIKTWPHWEPYPEQSPTVPTSIDIDDKNTAFKGLTNFLTIITCILSSVLVTTMH